MYFNDFSIKEVNAYYARRGGSQMANIGGRANMVSFSGLMEQAAAARRASAGGTEYITDIPCAFRSVQQNCADTFCGRK